MHPVRFFLLFLTLPAVSLSAQTLRFVRQIPDSVYFIGVGVQPAGAGYALTQQPRNYAAPFRFQRLDLTPEGEVAQGAQDILPGAAGFNPVFPLGDGAYARAAQNAFRLQRLAADGSIVWDSTYAFPDLDFNLNPAINSVKVIEPAPGGHFFVGCKATLIDSIAGLYCVAKISDTGELLWIKHLWDLGVATGVQLDTRFRHFTPTPDGGCVVNLNTSTGSIHTLFRLSPAGEVLWQKSYSGQIGDVRPLADGSAWVSYRQSIDYPILHIGPAGEVLLDTQVREMVFLPPPYFGVPQQLIPLPGGDLVVGGIYEGGSEVFFLRMTEAGQLLWFKNYPLFSGKKLRFWAGQPTPDQGFVWTGEVGNAAGTEKATFLIKTDSLGRLADNEVGGFVREDLNFNCAADSSEPTFAFWNVQIEQANRPPVFTSTNYAGRYALPILDTGAYAVTVFPANFVWEACVPVVEGVAPDTVGAVVPADFAIWNVYECPVMTVEVGAGFLRHCYDNTYAVSCRNNGSATADNAYVEVYLPPHLLLQSASLPFVQNGDTLTFALGTVEPQQSVGIQLVLRPDCDSTGLGQSMCVSAHVFPDTICQPLPGWAGALIEVSGACEGDSVRFQIRNTGTAPTSQSLDFIVIDDHVMTLEGMFSLGAGAVQEEVFPADGSTWRLYAEQEPNAPGTLIASAAVEGCAADGTPFTTGFVVQWPNDNGSPFWDTYCLQVVSSFDPNDKQATTLGAGAPHWIEPNTPLEYLIRFQNTGNDTAFTVVLRDTLSGLLDTASLRPGVASHPYAWTLDDTGVLTFTFSGILLPDSATNETASHGFVQFRIDQKPDLPDETLLENRAGIYFDANEVVLTNTVFHTVQRAFWLLSPPLGVLEISPAAHLTVQPNPAVGAVFVVLENAGSGGTLALFDVFGKKYWSATPAGPVVEIPRQGLPGGLYWLVWQTEDGRRAAGKLVWR